MENKILESIKDGSIFIYPTDTIYGLGCNAENREAVEKIKQIKGREADKPLSLIAPSKDWILQNTTAEKTLIDKYLPGPYTLILNKKDPDFLSHLSPIPTLGIRIPDHAFTKNIEKAKVPFITTSVNLSSEPPAKQIEEIKPEILNKVDKIVNTGPLSGTPSTLIFPDKIIKR